MPITTLNILLISAIVISWGCFFYALSRSRSREASVTMKFEEFRKQSKEQMAGIDSVIGLLSSLNEAGMTENQSGVSQASLAKMVLDYACQIHRCPQGSLMLMDKESNELTVVSARGIAERSALSARLKPGAGIAGRVWESGKMIVVENMETDVRFLKSADLEYRPHSLLSYPLKVKNRVIGVLNLYAAGPDHVFEERGIRLLSILANQCAYTFENLDLYSNLQEFYLEMVETLARVMEMKENVGDNRDLHKRMKAMVREISLELNLPEAIYKNIEFAFLMHGIGKIGIDDSILKKPNKLTQEEYEQIKKHPEIGQKMISKVRFLSPVTSLILYQQERWDGKGYPAGLSGEEIPLGARIVSVLNAYQAMVSERPYRKALSGSEALQELQKGAGSQFDPKVVSAFMKVLEKEKSKQGGKEENDNRSSDPSFKWTDKAKSA